jgi:hypothetical protein
MPYMLEQRMTVLRNRLPELFKRVERLEEHLGVEPAGDADPRAARRA